MSVNRQRDTCSETGKCPPFIIGEGGLYLSQLIAIEIMKTNFHTSVCDKQAIAGVLHLQVERLTFDH